MASYPKSVKSYSDVHQAFEGAGKYGSLTLHFETTAKAVTWAGRANAYRVLLRKQNEAAGREFACEFDHLMVRRKNGETVVKIAPRGFDFIATAPDGTEIKMDTQTLDRPVLSPFAQTEADKEIETFLASFNKTNKGEE